MAFYRFEVEKDNEKSGILRNSTSYMLGEFEKDLKIPDIYSFEKFNSCYMLNSVCFFTSHGLEHFKNPIKELIKFYLDEGFSVKILILPNSSFKNSKPSYKDEFQIVTNLKILKRSK